MAERTGLEPATPGVTGRYSDQLNYRSADSESRIIQNFKKSSTTQPIKVQRPPISET